MKACKREGINARHLFLSFPLAKITSITGAHSNATLMRISKPPDSGPFRCIMTAETLYSAWMEYLDSVIRPSADDRKVCVQTGNNALPSSRTFFPLFCTIFIQRYSIHYTIAGLLCVNQCSFLLLSPILSLSLPFFPALSHSFHLSFALFLCLSGLNALWFQKLIGLKA